MVRQTVWCYAVGLLLSNGIALADSGARVERLIEDRRALMADLGATLRAAWDKLEWGEIRTLSVEAQRIAERAERIPGYFPPGSFGEGSRARSSISEKQDEFLQMSKELVKAAEGLAEGARTRDSDVVRDRLYVVGYACRVCHRMFVMRPR